jgi:DNA ligase-associated metallophosphoesterase
LTFGTAALSADIEETPVLLTFRGHQFEALPSGALFWRAENALLVADLLLEKLSSFARRGSLLPPYDTGMTLRRLEADLDATGAAEVIALGDSFHRDEGTTTLLPADRLRLAALMNRARWTWISGNHDPAPHTLGGTCATVVERAGLTLIHEPTRNQQGVVAGHLHPSAHIAMNGRSVRRPCFVHDSRTFVMPAYGASAGTLNILAPAFVGLFHWPTLEVAMIGKGRVYPVSPKRLITGTEW